MRIHATINERTLRRTFREQNIGKRGLTVLDRDLPAFGLKVSAKGKRTLLRPRRAQARRPGCGSRHMQ